MNFGRQFSPAETQRRKELRRRILRPFARYPVLNWLMAVVGAALYFVGIAKLHDFRHIQQAGVKTMGVLLSIEGEPRGVGNGIYSFYVGDHRYIGHTRVGAQDRIGLYPGSAIKVSYLAENPAQNATSISWPDTAYMFVLTSALTIFFLLFFRWQIWKDRRTGVSL